MPDAAEEKKKICLRAAEIQVMCMEKFLRELSCTAESKISLLREAMDLIQKK